MFFSFSESQLRVNTMGDIVPISSTFMAVILQESLPTAARHGVRRVHLICTRQRRIVGVPRYVPPYIIPLLPGTDKCLQVVTEDRRVQNLYRTPHPDCAPQSQ